MQFIKKINSFWLAFVLVIASASCLFAQKGEVIHVTVETSKDNFVKGLKQTDIQVLQKGKPLTITSFSEQSEPASIGLLIDMSGSMLDAPVKDLDAVVSGMIEFARSEPENQYFLMGFNRKPVLLSDWTNDAKKLESGLADIHALIDNRGPRVTHLNETLVEAIAKLDAGANKKKVLVVFSDGLDNAHKPDKQVVLDEARASNAIVYFVRIVNVPTGMMVAAPFTVHDPNLETYIDEITKLTGGRLYDVRSSSPLDHKDDEYFRRFEPGEVFERIAMELSSQYAVAVEGLKFENGRARDISVKVQVPSELRKSSGTTAVRYRREFLRKQ